ncbi:unnamed protein product, partial [Adineta steineri]
MSIMSHLLSIRTSTFITRNIFRLTQNRLLSSTLPSSSKTETPTNILPNQIPSSEKKKTKYNISWKTVSVTIFGAASLIGFIYYLDQNKAKKRKVLRRAAVGKMAIGGPFSLITHEKKP